MEAAIRVWDLLRGPRATARDEARPRGRARAGSAPQEALYAGILEAALTRDLAALRAYGAWVAARADLEPARPPASPAFE